MAGPLSVIDNEGYQICQSLFAIGTGGWFGMGLYEGAPSKIPVVEQDFIFSAIAEEMGGILQSAFDGLCLLLFIVFEYRNADERPVLQAGGIRAWNGVWVSGIFDSRRSDKVHSVYRCDTAVSELWWKFPA